MTEALIGGFMVGVALGLLLGVAVTLWWVNRKGESRSVTEINIPFKSYIDIPQENCPTCWPPGAIGGSNVGCPTHGRRAAP